MPDQRFLRSRGPVTRWDVGNFNNRTPPGQYEDSRDFFGIGTEPTFDDYFKTFTDRYRPQDEQTAKQFGIDQRDQEREIEELTREQELQKFRRQMASEQAAQDFFEQAAKMDDSGLAAFLSDRPEVLRSSDYGAIQDYLTMRKQKAQPQAGLQFTEAEAKKEFLDLIDAGADPQEAQKLFEQGDVVGMRLARRNLGGQQPQSLAPQIKAITADLDALDGALEKLEASGVKPTPSMIQRRELLTRQLQGLFEAQEGTPQAAATERPAASTAPPTAQRILDELAKRSQVPVQPYEGGYKAPQTGATPKTGRARQQAQKLTAKEKTDQEWTAAKDGLAYRAYELSGLPVEQINDLALKQQRGERITTGPAKARGGSTSREPAEELLIKSGIDPNEELTIGGKVYTARDVMRERLGEMGRELVKELRGERQLEKVQPELDEIDAILEGL